jgi:hypothetical protein
MPETTPNGAVHVDLRRESVLLAGLLGWIESGLQEEARGPGTRLPVTTAYGYGWNLVVLLVEGGGERGEDLGRISSRRASSRCVGAFSSLT